MPHTIIDIRKPLTIPDSHIVWGLVTNQQDLEENSMSLEAFSKIDAPLSRGNMTFEGNGLSFVASFKERIQHILEENGAFFSENSNEGHAQKNQNISFNTIQPYPKGDKEGLYPTILIQP